MKTNKKSIYIFIAICVLLIIIFLINTKKIPIEKNKMQAIFLTNNQVYFGKLSVLTKNDFKLENVYYLQADQNISKENSDLNLIKLGSEIHGPENIMYISKDNVLFWENLRTDSRIVKIINELK